MTDSVERGLRRIGVTVSKPVLAILCIIFGIVLIVYPPLVAYIIGIFLIIQGILLLTDYMETSRQQPTYRPPPPTYTPPPAPPETAETPPATPPTEA